MLQGLCCGGYAAGAMAQGLCCRDYAAGAMRCDAMKSRSAPQNKHKPAQKRGGEGRGEQKEEREEKPSERVENDTPLALQENAPTPPPATPMGEAACQKRGARKTVELRW